MPLRFSANLGFLWTELPLVDAIHAAKNAGFDAVECHWPYETDHALTRSALEDTGLRMVGLNTIRGGTGENGLLALSGSEQDARIAIDQALSYAANVGATNVHAMAGNAWGKTALNCFVGNLEYACDQAAKLDLTILIEPLNVFDAPSYFLQRTDHAAEIISHVGARNLKLMFDCYHVQIMEGDLSRKLQKLLPIIGHIQIASVPNRAEPNSGEINYPYIFDHLENIGYKGYVGAEYRPSENTENSLGWLQQQLQMRR